MAIGGEEDRHLPGDQAQPRCEIEVCILHQVLVGYVIKAHPQPLDAGHLDGLLALHQRLHIDVAAVRLEETILAPARAVGRLHRVHSVAQLHAPGLPLGQRKQPGMFRSAFREAMPQILERLREEREFTEEVIEVPVRAVDSHVAPKRSGTGGRSQAYSGQLLRPGATPGGCAAANCPLTAGPDRGRHETFARPPGSIWSKVGGT